MPIVKTFLKTITIKNKYSYRLLRVDADKDTWFEADPISKGVVRTAESEKILNIILENDAMNMMRQEQARVR